MQCQRSVSCCSSLFTSSSSSSSNSNKTFIDQQHYRPMQKIGSFVTLKDLGKSNYHHHHNNNNKEQKRGLNKPLSSTTTTTTTIKKPRRLGKRTNSIEEDFSFELENLFENEKKMDENSTTRTTIIINNTNSDKKKRKKFHPVDLSDLALNGDKWKKFFYSKESEEIEEKKEEMEENTENVYNNDFVERKCNFQGKQTNIFDFADDFERRWFVFQSRFSFKKSRCKQPKIHGNIYDKNIKTFHRQKSSPLFSSTALSSNIYIKSRLYFQIISKFMNKFSYYQLTFGGSSLALTRSQCKQIPHLMHYKHLLPFQEYFQIDFLNGMHLDLCDKQMKKFIRFPKQQTMNNHNSQLNAQLTNDGQFGVFQAHILVNENAPNDLVNNRLLTLLMEIQTREITPEDYDNLLLLDELRVKPKTIEEHEIQQLKTKIINEELFEESASCCICQEIYNIDKDEVKFLPCDHFFHSACIDRWLMNSSKNCPLDGVPVNT